jgi:RNA polymerase sigma-70 factor (ECF subfamily)
MRAASPTTASFGATLVLAARRAVPVIFIAENPSSRTIVRAIKAGAVEVLTTPLDKELLVDAIRPLFAGYYGGSSPPAALKIANWSRFGTCIRLQLPPSPHDDMSESTVEAATLQALYCDHHRWLVSWLQRKVGCSYLAADLAQDTFVRLLTSRRAPESGSEPRKLLSQVARGLMIDHWRRRDVEQAYLRAIAHLPAVEVPSAEHCVLIIESLMRVEALIRDLPEMTRRVFLLSQLDDVPLNEIAATIGMPVITVRRHIRRALIACLAVG